MEIERLNSRQDCIILFLGAGFDRAFGLPDFDELLNQIYSSLDNFARHYLKEPSTFIDEIKKIHKSKIFKYKNKIKLDAYNNLILNQESNINWKDKESELKNYYDIDKKFFNQTSKNILRHIIIDDILNKKFLLPDLKVELNKLFDTFKIISKNFWLIVLTTNISDLFSDLKENNDINIFKLHNHNNQKYNYYIFESDFLKIEYKNNLNNNKIKLLNMLKKIDKQVNLHFYYLGYDFNDQEINLFFNDDEFINTIKMFNKILVKFLIYDKEIIYDNNNFLPINKLDPPYNNFAITLKNNYLPNLSNINFLGLVNDNNIKSLELELISLNKIEYDKAKKYINLWEEKQKIFNFINNYINKTGDKND